MKKFINKMLAVACMIPCAIGLTACGKGDGDSQSKLNAEGFTALKSASTTVEEKPVAGTTYEMSYTQVQSMTPSVDSAIANNEYAKSALSKMPNSSTTYEHQASFAYSEDGTSALKYKQRQISTDDKTSDTETLSTDAGITEEPEWYEESQYIVKDGDKFILYSINGSGDEQQISATYVGADHIKFLVENSYSEEYLSGFDTSFVKYINESDTVAEFSEKIKEMASLLEEDGIAIKLEDVNSTINTQYNEDTKNYTVNVKLTIANITVDMSSMGITLSAGMTFTNSVEMDMSVVFNSQRLLSYDMEMEVNSNASMSLKTMMENTPGVPDSVLQLIPDGNISMNVKMSGSAKCEFKEGVDASLTPTNLKTLYGDRDVNLPYSNVVLFIDGFDEGVSTKVLAGVKFEDAINFAEIKPAILAEVKNKFDVDEEAFKSIKLYLDKECTIEASIENITKCPSYNIYLYVKIELNEGYSKVFVNLSTNYGTSKIQLICPVNATITIEKLLNGTNINYVDSIKLDGVSVDLNSENITIGTNGEYTVDIKINYNKTTSDTTL